MPRAQIFEVLMIPLAMLLFVVLAQGTPPPTPSVPLAPAQSGAKRDPLPAVAPDPEVAAWAASLASRLGDPNRAIARSATAGLIALGPQAVPELRRVAAGADPLAARAAQHAMEEIRLGPPHARPGGPAGPGGRGPGPDGPRGPRERGAGPAGRPSGAPPVGPPPPRDGERKPH